MTKTTCIVMTVCIVWPVVVRGSVAARRQQTERTVAVWALIQYSLASILHPVVAENMSYAPLDESRTNGNGAIHHHSAVEDDYDEEARPVASPSASSSPALGGNSRKSLEEPLTETSEHDESSDPFYVFREDLYRKLESVDESLAEYLRIVHQTDTAANAGELRDTKKLLKRHLKNAESTLKDVHMTVQVVESDREKFSHINDKELYERTALVHTSRDRLQRAKQEMNSEAVKAKLLQDERAIAARRGNSMGARTNAERENTALIVDSQARQSLLMQHQDETLEDLDVAVTRVSEMAANIGDEIGQQNKMLTEMEEDLTNVEEELGMVMGKLAKFLKTKDTWQLGTILCLIATVVVLFFLVLYT